MYDEPASQGVRATALSMPDAAAAQVRQRPAVERCVEAATTSPASLTPVTPEQLGRWLDEHGRALVLFARQWCGSADDVVQEAFVRLARQPTAPDNVAAWLYCVVRNGALSAARSEGRRRRHEAAASSETRSWFVPARKTALDGETAVTALARLPLEEREVIVAHLWGGLTFAEIGEVISISSSTAHRRYETGLKQLREWLR